MDIACVMEKWFKILKSGEHVDANGTHVTFSEGDIHAFADKYNTQPDESRHRAPLVFGSHKDGPAHGWVDQLRAITEKGTTYLEAKFSEVQDAAKDILSKGLFKYPSTALYGGGLVRHVTVLGATPPAIKGLDRISFSEGEQFAEYTLTQSEGNPVNKKKPVDGNATATPEGDPEGKSGDTKDPATQFSESDFQKQMAEMQKELKEAKQKNSELESVIFSERADREKVDFRTFLDDKASFMPDAVKEKLTLVFNELSTEQSFEFSEGDSKVKQSPREALKSAIEALPNPMLFREYEGGNDRSTDDSKRAEEDMKNMFGGGK